MLKSGGSTATLCAFTATLCARACGPAEAADPVTWGVTTYVGALYHRRLARRYLRSRFGVNIRRPRRRIGSRGPRTVHERAMYAWGVFEYASNDRALRDARWLLDEGARRGVDAWEVAWHLAGLIILEAWKVSPAWLLGHTIGTLSEAPQDSALAENLSASFAGWTETQLRIQPSANPRLRCAVSTPGPTPWCGIFASWFVAASLSKGLLDPLQDSTRCSLQRNEGFAWSRCCPKWKLSRSLMSGPAQRLPVQTW